ncbi:T6SS immunity protein Tdi1 domain-containing protein [Vacuolonema iberomarrocanum]|uniref:T6SS immunity protein Tdi1 domain-containing protein n=1 Tax=Vacuolonema iberomarrocanum TaxID=3454632 RepID=UPI0019EEF08D|nr:DUF1851 domain-containing protein [filamentous cyanobacterium LEGE 07170]
MTNLLREIRDSWGWTGLNPVEIIGENAFGNLIIKDGDGRYWRLCPEDLYCLVVADNRADLDDLSRDKEFLSDWYMSRLVESAERELGTLSVGRKYCLVIPGVLGGTYDVSNIKTIPLVELIRFSGDLARQIENLPDGMEIKLKVAD